MIRLATWIIVSLLLTAGIAWLIAIWEWAAAIL
jgi:hypothetical protein